MVVLGNRFCGDSSSYGVSVMLFHERRAKLDAKKWHYWHKSKAHVSRCKRYVILTHESSHLAAFFLVGIFAFLLDSG